MDAESVLKGVSEIKVELVSWFRLAEASVKGDSELVATVEGDSKLVAVERLETRGDAVSDLKLG